jgi:hypothetical protein
VTVIVAIYPKGQLISEQPCGVLNVPKKQQNCCKDLDQIRKIETHYHAN